MAEPSRAQKAATLRESLRIQQVNDADLNRILTIAANDAKRTVMSLEGKEGIGASVRRVQTELAEEHIQMWREAIKGSVEVGIGDGVDAASNQFAIFDELFTSENIGGSLGFWHASLLQTSREGIQSLVSRKENGITLSQRVYRDGVIQSGKMNDLIDSGLLRGLNAKELSKEVFDYVDPHTPGGASYAAKRLARSEINNAFHQTSIRRMQDSPWVNGVRWNLSSSHPKPDECDEFAHDEHTRTLGPGVFRVQDVPSKPHPQCFCYVTPVTMDDDEFIKQWNNGKFDDYVNNRMGCERL